MRPRAGAIRPGRMLAAMPLALSAAGCGSGDPTASNPRLVFEDGFVSPLEEVTIEAEGGTVVGGYDAWLKLNPRDADPTPRFAALYREIDCSEPLAFFAHVLGGGGFPAQGTGWVCRFYVDPRLEFDNGRWLVDSPTDGRVYFRVWKRY